MNFKDELGRIRPPPAHTHIVWLEYENYENNHTDEYWQLSDTQITNIR